MNRFLYKPHYRENVPLYLQTSISAADSLASASVH